MGASSALQTYSNIIDYGLRKVRLRVDRLVLQSFMAGVFIGMAGNACISLAGGFPTDPADPRSITPMMQKFIFASIFPVAFIAIITTGAELFTGNTMTMLICLFERRVTFLQLLKNWLGSFIGNWLGTLFSAYFLTYLCCHFEKAPYIDYLNATAEYKTSHGWGSCFLRGVGCNMWVCLALWFVLACDDWSGKILALWFPIVCFVLSSYEHIIANLYTLQLCAMMGVRTSLSTMITSNLLPTLLGNIVGGCAFIGAVYFYVFHHDIQNGGSGGESHFEVAALDPSRRCKGHELLKSCDEGGKGKYLGGPAGATTPHERSGFLLKDGIPSLQLPGGGAGGGGGYCPAGAATAAECSEQGSNNFNNEKDSGGARDFSATRPARGDREHSRSPAHVSVGKGVNTTGESGVEMGRYANDALVASSETWGGETSTNAGYAYSSDNMATNGREASSNAVLKPDAVHAAAVDLGKQRTVDDLRRGEWPSV